jgi:hypothetical protein
MTSPISVTDKMQNFGMGSPTTRPGMKKNR